MMGRIIRIFAAGALALAACGGDDGGSASGGEESAPATHDLIVRVTAESILTCTQAITSSGLEVGNGSRLTVTDQDGTVVGTATFDLTPRAESCDWTARSDIADGADFYTLDAGGELGTFSAAELDQMRWRVWFNITISGDVRI